MGTRAKVKEKRMMSLGTLGLADVSDAARSYIDRGWHPVPVSKGEKSPKIPGWQETDFVPEDFDPDQNIGISLGASGLTEVDYDCEEAAFVGEDCPKPLLTIDYLKLVAVLVYLSEVQLRYVDIVEQRVHK